MLLHNSTFLIHLSNLDFLLYNITTTQATIRFSLSILSFSKIFSKKRIFCDFVGAKLSIPRIFRKDTVAFCRNFLYNEIINKYANSSLKRQRASPLCVQSANLFVTSLRRSVTILLALSNIFHTFPGGEYRNCAFCIMHCAFRASAR